MRICDIADKIPCQSMFRICNMGNYAMAPIAIFLDTLDRKYPFYTVLKLWDCLFQIKWTIQRRALKEGKQFSLVNEMKMVFMFWGTAHCSARLLHLTYILNNESKDVLMSEFPWDKILLPCKIHVCGLICRSKKKEGWMSQKDVYLRLCIFQPKNLIDLPPPQCTCAVI